MAGEEVGDQKFGSWSLGSKGVIGLGLLDLRNHGRGVMTPELEGAGDSEFRIWGRRG